MQRIWKGAGAGATILLIIIINFHTKRMSWNRPDCHTLWNFAKSEEMLKGLVGAAG